MSYIYEPEIEEEDEGYSIPKILVAVLLLVVVGAGIYIISQQRKIKDVVFMLKSEKEQVDKDLTEMIEKYNLAIDDNTDLSDELSAERDRIIRFRDSIRNVKKEDFNKLNTLEKTIKDLKSSSAIAFETPTSNTSTKEPEVKSSRSQSSPDKKDNGNKSSIETPTNSGLQSQPNNTNTSNEVVTTTSIPANNQNDPKGDTESSVTPAKTTIQSFSKVEVPPTYPGCTGNATEKKACFNQKVRSALTKNFNIDAIDNLDSGTNRVFVSFTVDKFGNVTDVKARGKNELLEKEAINATKSLPKMSAARQNGVPVDINYNVPITFVIQ